MDRRIRDSKLALRLNEIARQEGTSPVLVKSKLRGLRLPHLESVRREHVTSRKDLACKLTHSHGYIGAIERGKTGVMGVAAASEIAGHLEVYPSELADRDALESYLSPENSKVGNLLKKEAAPKGAEPPAGEKEWTANIGGGLVGKVLAFFKS